MEIAVGAAILLCAAACSGDEGGENSERSRSHVEAKECLEADGFRTMAGDVGTRTDRDSPDHFLYAYEKEAHAEIAFYDDLGRAKQYEAGIRENARNFDGDVRRIAQATIVWLKRPPLGARLRVERCVAAP